jgi:hypothetical protein
LLGTHCRRTVRGSPRKTLGPPPGCKPDLVDLPYLS